MREGLTFDELRNFIDAQKDLEIEERLCGHDAFADGMNRVIELLEFVLDVLVN